MEEQIQVFKSRITQWGIAIVCFIIGTIPLLATTLESKFNTGVIKLLFFALTGC